LATPPLTQARLTDKECEGLIIGGIKKLFPTHKFIAEESHAVDGEYEVTVSPSLVLADRACLV
jgi:fructose-1,6-bisphosphatase/inositol monophosphatase family enzyme